MPWQKMQNLSLVWLGVINATIFVLLIELVFRVLYFQYLYEESRLQASLSSDVHICTSFITSFGLRWYSDLSVIFVSIIAASFIISKSLPNLKKTSIAFWQIVGFFTVVFSIVLNTVRFQISDFLSCGKLNCNGLSLNEIPEIYYQKLFQAAIFLAIVLGFNFVFAALFVKRKQRLS